QIWIKISDVPVLEKLFVLFQDQFCNFEYINSLDFNTIQGLGTSNVNNINNFLYSLVEKNEEYKRKKLLINDIDSLSIKEDCLSIVLKRYLSEYANDRDDSILKKILLIDFKTIIGKIKRTDLNKVVQFRDKIFNESILFREGKISGHDSSFYWSYEEYLNQDFDIIEDLISLHYTFSEIMDNRSFEIFKYRTGFTEEVKTLGEVGSIFGVERERIRQIQVKIFIRIQNCLPVSPQDLSLLLLKALEDDEDRIDEFAQYFSDENSFCLYLDALSNNDDGFWKDQFFPIFDKEIFDDLILTYPSPYSYETISETIKNYYGYEGFQLKRVFNNEVIKIFTIDDDGYTPKKLSQHYAITHVLTNWPNGLKWNTVLEISNNRKLRDNDFDLSRLIGDRFLQSGYVYFSNRSKISEYRHTKFLPGDKDLYNEGLKRLRMFLDLNNRSEYTFGEFIETDDILKQGITYYDFRHWVREKGINYGIYFNGKSGSDIISLNEIDSNNKYNQKQSVLNLIEQNIGLTFVDDIVFKIRSKSYGHAYHYLTELIEDRKIIQFKEKAFCSPKYIFKNEINKNEILRIIKRLPFEKYEIIEVDYLRMIANRLLCKSYSKILYSSLVNYFSEELKIYKSYGLLSKSPISYNGFLAIANENCNVKLNDDENVQRLKEIVFTTEEAYRVVLSNWKQNHNTSRNGDKTI
ncbi:MAG: hypothetical protein JXR95_11660, partial [Deltaproteobacteria bacterium]|nr:hypothetical protein [Deltaproteobacteria bacterium]